MVVIQLNQSSVIAHCTLSTFFYKKMMQSVKLNAKAVYGARRAAGRCQVAVRAATALPTGVRVKGFDMILSYDLMDKMLLVMYIWCIVECGC